MKRVEAIALFQDLEKAIRVNSFSEVEKKLENLNEADQIELYYIALEKGSRVVTIDLVTRYSVVRKEVGRVGLRELDMPDQQRSQAWKTKGLMAGAFVTGGLGVTFGVSLFDTSGKLATTQLFETLGIGNVEILMGCLAVSALVCALFIVAYCRNTNNSLCRGDTSVDFSGSEETNSYSS